MNSFSDLLAIDATIQVKIELIPRMDKDAPWCVLRINGDTLWNNRLANPWSCTVPLPLLDPLCLEISLREKVYQQHTETGIMIDKISIDGFDIIPRWTGKASYINDHDHVSPTSYLGFNGTWKLEIEEPFYRWRHRVLGYGWLLDPY